MSWFYKHCLRPALFTQDAEAIHEFTLRCLGWTAGQPLVSAACADWFQPPRLGVHQFGLHFPNPVGLAAGMDKNADALPVWSALGFGFSELGAVTWQAQSGNPPPRLFRAVAEEAIINRMGFNNVGAEALANRLADWRARGRWPAHPVAINLGKSKVTPLDQAAGDYANSLRRLWAHADFFVINVSSPNTPNLRQLQDKTALDEVLAAVQEVNVSQARLAHEVHPQAGSPGGMINPSLQFTPPISGKPILVKVAPDLAFEALDEILELTGPRQVAGLVATNTTITRPSTNEPAIQRVYAETGGLSGAPLRARSTEVIRHLYRQTRGRLPIIGVGGIFTADDAWRKIIAGASLVQVYTGLVFEGPAIAKSIVRGLRERLAAEGLVDLSQAVGISTES